MIWIKWNSSYKGNKFRGLGQDKDYTSKISKYKIIKTIKNKNPMDSISIKLK